MKPIELFTAGISEMKNRIPVSAIDKFSRVKTEGRTGEQLLSSQLSKYNCRIIPIISAVIIVVTFVAALLEGGLFGGNAARIVSEVILIVTSVSGIGFGYYFGGKYPAFYPYIFWSMFAVSYIIKVFSFDGEAMTFCQTAVTLLTLCAVPVFRPCISIAANVVIVIFYSVFCGLCGYSAYYPFAAFAMAALCVFVSVTLYSLFAARMMDSRIIREDRQRMKMTAQIDSRTGLYSRAYGIQRVEQELKGNESIALLIVDIDKFSEYNRVNGSEKSDLMLKKICNCIKIIAKRSTEIVCRLESDIIMIALPIREEKEAVLMCEEIRSGIKTMDIPFPESTPYPCVTVTVSMAISGGGESFDTLFEKARHSMHIAKKAGGNCIGFKERTFNPDAK